MNKTGIIRLLEDELKRIQLNIKVVESLEPNKIYRVKFKEWDGQINPATNKYDSVDVQREFIGVLKGYNKESLRFEVLCVEHSRKMSFELDRYVRQVTREPNKKHKPYEHSLKFGSILEWCEWENTNTPHFEAPFIVNYAYVSPKMKKMCFGH